MTTRLRMQACLACGHKMDLHAQLAGDGEKNAKPTPNDVTLCIRCGCVMLFDDKLRFRMPTVFELYELEQDSRVQEAIKAIGRLDFALAQNAARQRMKSPPRQ